MKSGPRLPQLEKALAQKRRPNTAIKKERKKEILKKKKSKMVMIKKKEKVPSEDVDKSEPLHIIEDGMENCCGCWGKQFGGYSIN